MFYLFWQLGFEHITDFAGFDHILFLLSLCVGYRFAQWRQLLVLITAFTIGHSITLALAALQIVILPEKIIEVAIAATIACSALITIFDRKQIAETKKIQQLYAAALVFGLIHGLGFSNYLRSMLGNDSSILMPLLSFNIGLECGQICIVLLLLSINNGANKLMRINRTYWNTTIAIMLLAWSLYLIVERSLSKF